MRHRQIEGSPHPRKDTPLVTIRDVARLAGVSVATVSRTLAEPDTVRPMRRDRVRAAIETLDFTPDPIARQLRQRRSETIIVVVPQISNPFFAGIIQAIENIAHDRGFRILVGETRSTQQRLDHYADMVQKRVAGGLILLGELLPTVVRRALDQGQAKPPIPLVLACEPVEGLECPTVMIDNVAAARLAVEHLVASDRSRIATITGPLRHLLSRNRLRGYREAIMEAGLLLHDSWVVEGDFSAASGYGAMLRLLDAVERPDAVFCAGDEMAIGALHAIRERGLVVPRAIAVIGFDDLTFGAFAAPTLTTIRQPVQEIGETAMRMMDALLSEPTIEHSVALLAHTLVRRESTARG